MTQPHDHNQRQHPQQRDTSHASTAGQQGQGAKNPDRTGIDAQDEDLSPAAKQVLKTLSTGALAEQYVRLLADFENFRRRSTVDLDERRKAGVAAAVRALLPVVDDIERATSLARDESTDRAALLHGLEMVVKNLDASLATLGIEPIQTEGEPFDPTFHEAIMSEPSSEVTTETVVGELQRGYRYQDQVIRPALVRVAIPEEGTPAATVAHEHGTEE